MIDFEIEILHTHKHNEEKGHVFTDMMKQKHILIPTFFGHTFLTIPNYS